MRMRVIGSKAMVGLMAVLLLFTMLLPAGAADAIDPARMGSLTLEYPFADATFSLYRVADVSATAQFTPCGAFADDPVSFTEVENTEAWRELAQTLAALAARDNRAVTAQATTDENGALRFAELPAGLYLLTGTATVTEGLRHTPSPTLVSLPQKTAEDAWEYDATVSPKYDEETVSETVSRRVVKIWENTPDAARPQSVEVQLLCDGTVTDTVTLGVDNDWTYTWEKLDAAHTWQVTEKTTLSGFTVSVRQEGDAFVVTNTYQVSTTPPPTLPQTGQIWWPVYPLVAAGLLLFGIGWIQRRRSRGDRT